jgi:hypothetical protein
MFAPDKELELKILETMICSREAVQTGAVRIRMWWLSF